MKAVYSLISMASALLLCGAGILPTVDELQEHYGSLTASPHGKQTIYSFTDDAGFRELLYTDTTTGKSVMHSVISIDLRTIPEKLWPGHAWIAQHKPIRVERERLPFGSRVETWFYPGKVQLHKHFVVEGMDAVTILLPD